MFHPKQGALAAGLLRIAHKLCCYLPHDGRPVPARWRCDCKYGADHVGTATESGNGCPEARAGADIIGKMTPAEYARIAKRPTLGWYRNSSEACGMRGGLEPAFALRLGSTGREIATAWPSGTWHTWDAHGTGGENASAPTVRDAQRAAVEALIRQQADPRKGWAVHKRVTVAALSALLGDVP